jgi:hypothetical protein
MDPPVAVGTDADEVIQPRPGLTGDMERRDVVILDVALAPSPVRRSVVEAADLARQVAAPATNLVDLPAVESLVAFTSQMAPQEKPPLRRARIVVGLVRVDGRRSLELPAAAAS